MRLLAERSRLEGSLRAIATLALAGLVVGAFLLRNTPGGQRMNAADLPGALQGWTTRPPADTMGLRLSAGLDRSTLDFLRALRANGSVVAWANEGIPPVMLETEPRQDPAGGILARITGTSGAVVSISDSLGVLDSIRIDRLGTTVRVPAFSGKIAVLAGSTVASVMPSVTGPARSIVVLGMAGWESKFVIRALEERGWTVESRIGLAPNLATLRGKPFPLDTARHATVVALDSSAGSYIREIQQFVRAGGGLIVGAGAAAYFARSPSAEITTLARPDRGVTLAAWRAGAGRVIRTDQTESWRWRMLQGENAVADHRNWWAGLVSAVALRAGSNAQAGTPAPLAALTLELGPPSSLPGDETGTRLWPALLTVFLVSLFAEWLSRRLRGAA